MMEFKKLTKFNYINASKKACNHFHYICLYCRHTHCGISQRRHVFRVYIIYSNCARLHNSFFFMMIYGENGLFTLKNVSKNDWKLLIRVVGIKMSWMEKGKKIKRGGGGGVIRDLRVYSNSWRRTSDTFPLEIFVKYFFCKYLFRSVKQFWWMDILQLKEKIH